MMESPVETHLLRHETNNVDLWIELGYIRVWWLEVDKTLASFEFLG